MVLHEQVKALGGGTLVGIELEVVVERKSQSAVLIVKLHVHGVVNARGSTIEVVDSSVDAVLDIVLEELWTLDFVGNCVAS
jgi:hypothetical protein